MNLKKFLITLFVLNLFNSVQAFDRNDNLDISEGNKVVLSNILNRQLILNEDNNRILPVGTQMMMLKRGTVIYVLPEEEDGSRLEIIIYGNGRIEHVTHRRCCESIRFCFIL